MFVPLDLADLASVVRAAERVAEMTPRLDALINNAGVGGARGRTHDGFELAFGVNYLGHYALTRHLLARVPSIARVVHLSSGSHSRAKALDFDAVRRPTRTLTGISEYAVSKLSVMLFHHELARREPRVVSLAADPGDVASEAWRHVPCVVRPLVVRGMKSPAEGASTSVYCATEPSLASASGASFVNERPFEASALSRDRGLARRLWERSARDVGVAP
jgi:NAD(P)-dependent dehydrogenase (short-subunit alcohol dehydrogenase family)